MLCFSMLKIFKCGSPGTTQTVRTTGQPFPPPSARSRTVSATAVEAARLQPRRNLPDRHRKTAGHFAESIMRCADAECPSARFVFLYVRPTAEFRLESGKFKVSIISKHSYSYQFFLMYIYFQSASSSSRCSYHTSTETVHSAIRHAMRFSSAWLYRRRIRTSATTSPSTRRCAPFWLPDWADSTRCYRIPLKSRRPTGIESLAMMYRKLPN